MVKKSVNYFMAKMKDANKSYKLMSPVLHRVYLLDFHLNFSRALLTRTDFALTDTENFGRARSIAIKWQKPLPIEFRQVVTGLECDWD